MRANRKVGTKPEVELRSRLHRGGLRFRKHLPVIAQGLRVRPDIVFPCRRVAVFVDGCFWHRCPAHRTVPVSNADYWAPKLQRNADRDRRVDAALSSDGWVVIRLWEHELRAGHDIAVARIRSAVVGV